MKVKVIKGIAGLSEGDILDWNKDKKVFEISKTDEEISDFYKSSSTSNYSLSNDTILDHANNFIFITDEGKEVSITKKEESIDKDKQIADLESRVKELTIKNKKLEGDLFLLPREIPSYYMRPLTLKEFFKYYV